MQEQNNTKNEQFFRTGENQCWLNFYNEPIKLVSVFILISFFGNRPFHHKIIRGIVFRENFLCNQSNSKKDLLLF